MLEPFGGQPDRARADGVRDFFHVGMVRYGGRVESAFAGPLAGAALVPVSRIANNPLRVEVRTRKVDDGAGGLADQSFKFPVWFEARPTGRTAMCEALTKAREYLQAFLGVQPGCYPPIVINITDGQPTDGDPREAPKALHSLASRDGERWPPPSRRCAGRSSSRPNAATPRTSTRTPGRRTRRAAGSPWPAAPPKPRSQAGGRSC